MARVGLTARTSLRRFADQLLETAARATASGPRLAFAVAGRGLEVRFASTPLYDALGPAWSSLPIADGGATIHVVDRDSSLDPPAPPWPADAYRPRDEVAGVGDDQLEIGYQLATGTLMVWDAEVGTGVWWTRSSAAISVWERAMPMRAVLRWALRDKGLALVHGAAVGVGADLALLVGVGGSGKSTIALAAHQAGWRYVADDYCVVDPATRTVAPVTSFAKVTDATLAKLPGLEALRAPLPLTPDGKVVLSMPLTADGGRLGLVALPRVVPATAPPTPVGPAATMTALAPTSLLQMPGSRPVDRELLGQVVRGLPALRLPSGPDLDATLDGLRSSLEAS